MTEQTDLFDLPTEKVAIASLRPQPENYRQHPEDQIAHIVESITRLGVYRPIVVSEDNVILAGHGLCEALTQMGASDDGRVKMARSLERQWPRLVTTHRIYDRAQHLVKSWRFAQTPIPVT